MRVEDPFASPDADYSRFGSATSNLPRFNYHTNYGRSVPQATPQPPRYSEIFGARTVMDRSWYDPRGWSGRKKSIIGVCVVVVVVAVIVGAVEGVKANAYPNYSQLNYTLVDTFSGSSFFENFEYYTSTDPTNGFVQYVFPSIFWPSSHHMLTMAKICRLADSLNDESDVCVGFNCCD